MSLNEKVDHFATGGIPEVTTMPAGRLIPLYLVHACLYYQLGHSTITDREFDTLAERIYHEWFQLEHVHKPLIERDSLRTTGAYIKFPLIVEHTAKSIYNKTFTEYTHKPKKKMALNARSKGQRGEREIIDLLQPHVDEVSGYNQVTPPLLQRNQMQTHRGGYDIVGLPMFAFEVKRVETSQDGQIASWWKQCVGQATSGEEPVLFFRRNGAKWKVMLFTRLDLDARRRYKVPSIVDIDHFIFYMKNRLHCHQMNSK